MATRAAFRPPDPNDPNAQGGGEPPGGLFGALQQLLLGAGYSEEEKNAIRENAAGVLAAQKASAQGQLSNHLASSGNAAGYAGAMSGLDMSAARTASEQARQNQIDFANEGERRKELGAAGLQSLLGMNTAADVALSGQETGLATLGAGTDTYGQENRDYSQEDYKGTPDASAGKPGAKPGASGGKNPDGTMAGSKPYINPSTGKAYQYDPKLGWQNIPTSKPLTDAEIDGINGGTMYIDPTTGQVTPYPPTPGLPGGEVPPEQVPGQYVPAPDLPPGWGNQDPPPGEVLPTPTGGEPAPYDPMAGGDVLPTPTGGEPAPYDPMAGNVRVAPGRNLNSVYQRLRFS